MNNYLFSFLIFFLVGGDAYALNIDWADGLSTKAKKIYLNKIVQFPCENIPKYLKDENSYEKLYVSIRDSGLFRLKHCAKILNKYESDIKLIDDFNLVLAFYYLQIGDKSKLSILINSFDKEAKKISDHISVELFGYLNDWDKTGRRLVRHAGYADGAGAEVLCSAIKWNRFLYGDSSFEKNWYLYGKQEKVDYEELKYMFEICSPAIN